jgi:hypothetical protein
MGMLDRNMLGVLRDIFHNPLLVLANHSFLHYSYQPKI